MIKIAIGLVVKGGKDFIENWIKQAEMLGDVIIVIDNGADSEVREQLITHNKVKYYVIQKNSERNMSRDYQKILEIAKEEECDWIWNMDIDELLSTLHIENFKEYLLNQELESIGFPLIEMRDDDKHYVMVTDDTDERKDGRLVHKCYKPLSHFEFDIKDKHGRAIPHNCPRTKAFVNVPILHFGHLTYEMREEKRKMYNKYNKDKVELLAPWLQEDKSKITIKHISNIFKEANKDDIKNNKYHNVSI